VGGRRGHRAAGDRTYAGIDLRLNGRLMLALALVLIVLALFINIVSVQFTARVNNVAVITEIVGIVVAAVAIFVSMRSTSVSTGGSPIVKQLACRRRWMDKPSKFQLDTEVLGALPIINHFCRRLGLAELLEKYLPHDDTRLKLAPATAIGAVVRRLVLHREPV
jgi:hypothetical protein